jgi:general secretion pathway protein J
MAGLTPGSRPDIPLPLGMEVTLEHERFGTLVRTFALPDFDPAVAQGAVNQANQAASEAEEESTEEEATGEQTGENTGTTGQGG